MRNVIILLFALCISFSTKAQDISGTWNGVLKVQGTQLRLTFNVDKTESDFSATMDSTD
jgi:hypothetical protein